MFSKSSAADLLYEGKVIVFVTSADQYLFVCESIQSELALHFFGYLLRNRPSISISLYLDQITQLHRQFLLSWSMVCFI